MKRMYGYVVAIALATCAAGVRAQSTTSAAIKQGLWETTITTTMQMQLPPELEARMAQLTTQQQTMMRARLAAGGAPPATTVTHSCSDSSTSLKQLLSEAQQEGTKCTFSNQTQTATGYSFDTSCTSEEGTAKGHSDFSMPDSDHVNGTTHMTAQANRKDGPASMTVDSKVSSKYLGASCGDVKPNRSVVVSK